MMKMGNIICQKILRNMVPEYSQNKYLRVVNYFLSESIIFFVLSIIVFMLSVDMVLTLSVFTIVVESVVVVVYPSGEVPV